MKSDLKTPQYVPSTFANIKTFQDNNEIINVDFINKDELISFIEANSVDNKFKLTIQKQKNDPTKASVTLNTYKPKPSSVDINSSSEDDDLPF